MATVNVEVDRLQRLADETAAASRLRIRQAFHDRWGSYFKCRQCGGRIEYDEYVGRERCPHGPHTTDPMLNGYSWTR